MILIFLFLTSCAYFEQPSSEVIVKKGWGKTYPVKKIPYYCYNTLGETMCYSSPLPNAQMRLTGQPFLYQPIKTKKRT